VLGGVEDPARLGVYCSGENAGTRLTGVMGSSCTSQTKRHFFFGEYDCTSTIVASVDVPELPDVEVPVGSATRSSRSRSSRSRSAALTTIIVLGSDIVEVPLTSCSAEEGGHAEDLSP
jgi:hypothetical protein